MDRRLTEIKAGKISFSGSMTFGEFVDDWYDDTEGELPGAHRVKYRYTLRTYVLPWLGDVRLSEVADRLKAHYKLLSREGRHRRCCYRRRNGSEGPGPARCRTGKPLASSSVENVHKVLHAVLRHAVAEGIFVVHPMTRVKGPGHAKKVYKIWTAKQARDGVGFCDRDTLAGARPSVATLAERTEVSTRTARRARRALRVLEASAVIVTELGGGRRSSRYRIVQPEPASMTGQAGQDDRRPPVSDPLPPVGRKRRPTAPKRSTTVPEDLRPLADALTSSGLRASFSLLPEQVTEQVTEIRDAIARHGVPALVRAAYAAHRAANPARWWSAWLGIRGGLRSPSEAPTPAPAATPADAPPPRDPDRNARAAAAREVLAARDIYRKAGAR
jgi:hypothetical protein